MSSLARKLQEQHNQEMQHVPQPERRQAGKSPVTPGERFIWFIFAGLICLGGIQVVSSQSQIYKVNKDIQEMKASISEQEKVNGDLKAQVDEMSTYERIMKKARELGLKLDPNKVKVGE